MFNLSFFTIFSLLGDGEFPYEDAELRVIRS